jgi:hypothetical protein
MMAIGWPLFGIYGLFHARPADFTALDLKNGERAVIRRRRDCVHALCLSRRKTGSNAKRATDTATTTSGKNWCFPNRQ